MEQDPKIDAIQGLEVKPSGEVLIGRIPYKFRWLLSRDPAKERFKT
jgi:hypothetical protein